MVFCKFFGFVRILKESIQLIPKNGKIMGLITIFHLLFTSTFFLFFKFTSDSLLRDMFIKESFIPISSINGSSLTSLLSSINQNFKLVLAIDFSLIFSYLFISIFSTNTIILISSISYYNKTLNFKDLGIMIFKSFKRLIFTMFYTTIIVIGYFFFCFSMATPFLATSNLYDFSMVIIFAIFAYIIYLYLSIVWVMALVVSIIEEGTYGVMALGKARKIIKGNEMKGFILNVVFNLLALIIFWGTQIIIKKWNVNKKNSMLILVNGSCLLKVFELVNYTVLYVHCKKEKGDEEVIELQESIEYSKIYNLPLTIDGTN
ncbi:uncharacterized protein LOC125877654 [Solanum stenotomum]|uniref:uncharacterized protein LOC125877654 n=1 Tax=Solanum stenotomum TaxID=172797 RepID=UPI0020D0211B|nr:uncharacterized protein LOC125877654 [Solanum stenotomum]